MGFERKVRYVAVYETEWLYKYRSREVARKSVHKLWYRRLGGPEYVRRP